ncbi:MAG: aldo/keto reductase [Xanthobacteraceae bacterium]|nr:aldo/keto reductase [Xanthobacteraceae bacterium]
MQVVEANGARIPIVGFGSMRLKQEAGVRVIAAALRIGYRHIDTAQAYENEREVGAAIRASGVARDEIFLTTKVAWQRFKAEDLTRSVNESLERLGVSHVDLLLLHWPNPTVPLAETLGALCKVKKAGLTRHIGISNFTLPLIEEAAKLSSEPIATHQIEVHPFIDRAKIVAASARHGMAITAYCPIARGRVPGNETLARIGARHGKTAAQVSLRWLVQQGIIVIPGTSKEERVAENFAILDFALSEAEMAEIAALARPDGRVVNPPHAPQWDG